MNQLYPIQQKEGLLVVSVPKDAINFDIYNKCEPPYIDFLSCNSDNYYVRTYLPQGEYELLGTYSPNEGFSFDPALIVDKFNNGVYRDYTDNSFWWPDKDTYNYYLYSKESALSLLSVNGVLFENPYGETEPDMISTPLSWNSEGLESDKLKWQEAQSKVVDKILFIQKK